MRHTTCDRCKKEFNDGCENYIVLKDEMKQEDNTIKFKIKLSVHATKQIITPKGASNESADICSNCAIELLLKDISQNLDYNVA